MADEVITLEFSGDIDKPGRYQTADGEWHEGLCPNFFAKTYVDGKQDFGGAEIIVNDEALFEKILKLLKEHRKGIEDERTLHER